MRIAELSRQSGVPVPTIKYYLREGLLPPGALSSPNQARYGIHHLHRLRLIRALVDLGQVPVARVKDIVTGLDSESLDLHDQIGRAHRAITPSRTMTTPATPTDATATDAGAPDTGSSDAGAPHTGTAATPYEAARAAATRQVEQLIAARGWTVEPDAPALTTLVETITALHTLDQDHLAGFLDAYADAVERFTEIEIAAVTSRADRTTPDQIAESVVIGTILGETLISSLRLLAQESVSAQTWRRPPG